MIQRKLTHSARKYRGGFSLVELLVVISIIGILMALLLPAVQSVRAAARRTQCRNNLRQIAIGIHNFEAAQRHYPGNGWGFRWIGDPDRGVGPKQPGGWIYQSLPYYEGSPLHALGRGTGPQKPDELGELSAVPFPLFKCPNRPGEQLGPVNPGIQFANATVPDIIARTDYAINEGDYITDTPGGPVTLAEGDDKNYPWTPVGQATGVSFLRSRIKPADVTDGASNTILVGEKYVSRGAYVEGGDDGYDQPLYSGVDLDLNRWTTGPPLPDGLSQQVRRFGSSHVGGCHIALCDGSVRQIKYAIDAGVFRNMGSRADGNAVEF